MIKLNKLINADNYQFTIKVMPHGNAHGLYIRNLTTNREHLLTEKWTVGECREWLRSHFIGEKGTKFNIVVQQGKIVADEQGFLHLE